MKKNITNKILMVRPVSFTFNEETAVNNHYQKKDNKPIQEIQNNALTEFDNMVEKLKKNRYRCQGYARYKRTTYPWQYIP